MNKKVVITAFLCLLIIFQGKSSDKAAVDERPPLKAVKHQNAVLNPLN